MRFLTLSTLILAIPSLSYAAPICDPRTYGAKADGMTNDAAAIQSAIDACSRSHGTVRLAGGQFVSGPLVLKSNMTLQVEQGSALLGSTNHADYRPATLMRQPAIEPLLHIVDAENVTITGGGVIDGRGQSWWEEARQFKDTGILGNPHPRPMGILIDHSKHVTIEHVTFQNAAFWQIVPYYSEYLAFRDLKVLAPQRNAPNTDGIDPFSSSHIVIDHYFSSVGDDNIAIKSGAINSPGPDAPSTDITITHCAFEAGHGLSIGSEVAGGVQHVHASDITFKGTDQGIRVKSNRDRGADISDLTFTNISMENVRTPILISEYYPKTAPEGTVESAPVTRLTPHFHSFSLTNISATGAQTAGYIVGLPEAQVVDVTLTNVSIAAERGMQIAYAKVTLHHVEVEAADHQPFVIAPTADVLGK